MLLLGVSQNDDAPDIGTSPFLSEHSILPSSPFDCTLEVIIRAAETVSEIADRASPPRPSKSAFIATVLVALSLSVFEQATAMSFEILLDEDNIWQDLALSFSHILFAILLLLFRADRFVVGFNGRESSVQ